MHHSFVMDDRICLKLQQVISKISVSSTMKSFLMLCFLSYFEEIMVKGED